MPQKDGGLAWPTTLYDEFLGGFSHGTAGIAPSLLAFARRTADETADALGRGALEFDRLLYQPDLQDWLDVRVRESRIGARYAGWCHGGAGIALGRVLCLGHLPEEEAVLRNEISAALARVERNDWGESDCLCHGNLGNMDIAITVARLFNGVSVEIRAREWLARIWTDSRRRGVWRTGIPGRNVALPGLFMGLAGIGYALLRAASPNEVPSVLALEGPRAPSPAGVGVS